MKVHVHVCPGKFNFGQVNGTKTLIIVASRIMNMMNPSYFAFLLHVQIFKALHIH